MHDEFCGTGDFFSEIWARRAKWGFDFGEGFRGGRGHWGGPRGGRSGRMFGQGDLKYVILRLLEEKPRHGYEIIKELEERFGGAYSPSPGTVYPTLTLLEDLGYAVARPEDGGKKIYEITEAGRQHLAENAPAVDNIFEKIGKFVENVFDAPMMDINRAFQRLGKAVYGTATRDMKNTERLTTIREVLERAAAEIEALGKTEPTG